MLVVAVLLLSAAVFIISQSADQAIATYAEIQAQPPSAAELALLSRQTPAQADTGHRTWAGAGLLAILLVTVAAFVFVMRGGSDLLRQWRLARKRPSSRQASAPRIPGAPDYYAPPVEQLPRAPRVQELPSWTESD
jgi:hypothetical protein